MCAVGMYVWVIRRLTMRAKILNRALKQRSQGTLKIKQLIFLRYY